jgi:flagellar FliL protein
MAVSAVKKEAPKPQAAAAAAAPAAAPAAEPTKKKGKLLLYAALGIVVLSGVGGGAWWYTKHEAGPATAKAEPAKPPVFAPLDTFTVNLAGEEGSQFLQVGLTLRLIDEPAAAALKLRMPEIRDRILLLLSAKKASDLLTLDGKRKLTTEIQTAVNTILVPGSAKMAAAPAAAPAAPAAASPTASAAAPAPAAAGEPASEQPGEAAPGAETPAVAQEPAAQEPAPAQAAAPVLPVTGVLFTSFIIQ